MVKKELERAELLYNEQRFDEAAHSWQRVLSQLTKPLDKFHVCGRICTCLCDVGKYRDALTYAGQQCELANTLNDVALKSEAYSNIAICNEKSCEFSKAISYCRSAQQHCSSVEDKQGLLKGQLAMCLGNAFLGTGEFLKAWNNYVTAMDVAKEHEDRVLELITSARMGTLFCCLGDYESSIAYCNNALEIMKRLSVGDPGVKHRRQVQVWLAQVNRKLGRYSEAMDYCEDAMKSAMTLSDRPVQAKCMYLFADIHRKKGDMERAHPRYESAFSIMAETGDRLGQVETLGGMAKLAAGLGQLDKAAELNEKALDLATKVGCKLEMLRCHARMRLLSESVGELSRAARHDGVMRQLITEMDLYCGVCDHVIGQTVQRLEPLTCGHFIHARCAVHLARSTLGRSHKGRRPCPSCRRLTALNPATS